MHIKILQGEVSMKIANKFLSLNIKTLCVLIIIATVVLIPAQDSLKNNSKTKIYEMTNKLVKKILVTEKQKSKLENILIEYFEGREKLSGNGKKESVLRQNADDKIKNLLDKKQNMKFKIIADQWWDLANK